MCTSNSSLYKINLCFCGLFQNGGKLKLHKNGVVFKNNKTGKVEQLNSSDLAFVKWMKVAFGYEVKFILNTGAQFKFEGFKESVRSQLQMSKFSVKLDMVKEHIMWLNWLGREIGHVAND